MNDKVYIYTPLDIRRTVSRLLDDLGAIGEEGVFAVRVVLNELLSNSLLHSGGTRTELFYRLSPEAVYGEIANDGEWFSAEKIGCSAVDMDHGRGIYLAKCYAESLSYDNEKHSVVFSIKLR